MAKKLIYLLIISVLMAGTLFACAPKTAEEPAAPAAEKPTEAEAPAAEEEQVTLTYWQVPNHPEMQALVEGLLEPFEEQNPNIKVEVVIIPWSDVETMWVSAIQSGETPDVGYPLAPLQMYRMGGLEPLDEYLDQEFLDTILKGPLEAGIYDGKLYALPMLVSSDTLYYNKDMFEAAGIELPDPMYSPSWEEFLDWNLKLKEAGYYGWDWGMRTMWDHTIWDVYRRFGVDETNADYTEVTFDTPEALAWAQAVQDLAQTYAVLPPKALTVDWNRSESFLEGESAMVEFWAGLAGQLEEYPDINWGVCKPFHGPGDNGEATGAYLAIGSTVMFKDSKHKEEAAELIKFIHSPEFTLEWNKQVGTFPAVQGGNAIFDDATPEKKEVANVIWSLLESGEAEFYYEWEGVTRWAQESFLPNWQSLMLGEMTPENFCKKVTEDGNRIINE